MKKKCIMGCLLAWAVIMSGCATLDTAKHEYIMRGQILEASDSGIYLCIGKHEGAEVGQVYTVYKFERTVGALEKSPHPAFKKVTVGSVKIIEIVDDHYAKAQKISGEAKVNDVVELSR